MARSACRIVPSTSGVPSATMEPCRASRTPSTGRVRVKLIEKFPGHDAKLVLIVVAPDKKDKRKSSGRIAVRRNGKRKSEHVCKRNDLLNQKMIGVIRQIVMKSHKNHDQDMPGQVP